MWERMTQPVDRRVGYVPNTISDPGSKKELCLAASSWSARIATGPGCIDFIDTLQQVRHLRNGKPLHPKQKVL